MKKVEKSILEYQTKNNHSSGSGPIPYDYWLHWFLSDRCNIDCQYCFTPRPERKFGKITTINIPALINTLNRTNKIFHISFTGKGEPTLTPNFVDACKEITKKHFVSFISNLTQKKIQDISEEINPNRVIFIVASAHVKELEEKHLLNRYIDNFHLLQSRGFPVTANAVAHPAIINEVAQFRNMFNKQGINLMFNPYQGEFKGKQYPHSYTEDEIKIFHLEELELNSPKRHSQYKKICNAGYYAAVVDTKGDVFPCNLPAPLKSRFLFVFS